MKAENYVTLISKDALTWSKVTVKTFSKNILQKIQILALLN